MLLILKILFQLSAKIIPQDTTGGGIPALPLVDTVIEPVIIALGPAHALLVNDIGAAQGRMKGVGLVLTKGAVTETVIIAAHRIIVNAEIMKEIAPALWNLVN
jgi:hypothetical protein